MTLFDMPATRSTDPETSHEAAASVSNVEFIREAIISILTLAPMTHGELWTEYKKRFPNTPCTDSGLRTRLSELVDAERAEFAEKWRLNVNGRRCRVWKVK